MWCNRLSHASFPDPDPSEFPTSEQFQVQRLSDCNFLNKNPGRGFKKTERAWTGHQSLQRFPDRCWRPRNDNQINLNLNKNLLLWLFRRTLNGLVTDCSVMHKTWVRFRKHCQILINNLITDGKFCIKIQFLRNVYLMGIWVAPTKNNSLRSSFYKKF